MFVLKSTHERKLHEKQTEINDLQLLVDNVSAKELARAKKRVAKLHEKEITLENTPLDFEETANPLFADKKPLPPRSEYDDRVNEAIKLFQARHNRSYVEKALDVSRKTARKYLQIAIAKRKVKKADYDTLNQ